MTQTATQQTTGTKFTMNGLQLLSSGQVTEKLVVGEHLWLHSKVYSRGGENALHAHLQEDHAFFAGFALGAPAAACSEPWLTGVGWDSHR